MGLFLFIIHGIILSLSSYSLCLFPIQKLLSHDIFQYFYPLIFSIIIFLLRERKPVVAHSWFFVHWWEPQRTSHLSLFHLFLDRATKEVGWVPCASLVGISSHCYCWGVTDFDEAVEPPSGAGCTPRCPEPSLLIPTMRSQGHVTLHLASCLNVSQALSVKMTLFVASFSQTPACLEQQLDAQPMLIFRTPISIWDTSLTIFLHSMSLPHLII